jgi:hypothetical protein
LSSQIVSIIIKYTELSKPAHTFVNADGVAGVGSFYMPQCAEKAASGAFSALTPN